MSKHSDNDCASNCLGNLLDRVERVLEFTHNYRPWAARAAAHCHDYAILYRMVLDGYPALEGALDAPADTIAGIIAEYDSFFSRDTREKRKFG